MKEHARLELLKEVAGTKLYEQRRKDCDFLLEDSGICDDIFSIVCDNALQFLFLSMTFCDPSGVTLWHILGSNYLVQRQAVERNPLPVHIVALCKLPASY